MYACHLSFVHVLQECVSAAAGPSQVWEVPQPREEGLPGIALVQVPVRGDGGKEPAARRQVVPQHQGVGQS